ncbi:MAG: UxaA family hydrolase [Pseudomonadota bacterium]
MTPAAPSFLGFERSDGRAGVRNHLVILSVTGLTGPTARRVGRVLPAAIVITHPFGSGLLGEDAVIQDRAIAGLASHPNVGALVVLGAEPSKVQAAVLAAEDRGRRVQGFSLADAGHDVLRLTDLAVRAGAASLRALSADRRIPLPASRLVLGLECGRSDPTSGLAANPLVGRLADRVLGQGGIAMIGETTEWLGAEHLLARRARTPEVAEAILDAAGRREAQALAAGLDLTGSNPSETNVRAGLTTIEEKSLGAIAKSGRAPIEGVLTYAEAPTAPGLWVMDAPAYAPESVTGFTAAGANLVLFTTGVGNGYVSALAPTLKISANAATVARLDLQLDIAADGVLAGEETLDVAADRAFETLLDVASGTLTFGEILGEGDEVIARFRASL